MPVTASYLPAQFRLQVVSDEASDTITVSRNAAGTILVNNGAVPVSGGTPTVANTDLIEIIGAGGNDIITLDEAMGALPAAEIFGGTGNDTLTGGSGGDTLSGEADDDILFGRGGNDILLGGAGNDTLTGGDADDQMFGGDGDDRMIWNPGDDSDLMEGGAGTDTVEVNGGGGAEVFTATANGTRVRFDRLDPAPFALDIGTSERLVVNMGGGDDTFSATGNLAALISVTVDGGTGNDTILGSNGADTLLGGDGDDFIDGQQGNDIAFLGIGNDIFQWDPGDGSDIVEGQAGDDTLLFNGSAANEIYALTANGARTQLTRNVGAIVMDLSSVEHVTISAVGGTDTIEIGDLTGTGTNAVTVNLSGTIGGTAGDAAADIVIVNGSNAINAVTVTGSGTSFSVAGLSATVTGNSAEAANDRLVINGLGGNDVLTATTLAAGIIQLTLDGGESDDTIFGSQGADIILGGNGNDTVVGDNGNDTVFLGGGNDVFQWDPGDGNDVIEGQAGTDELRFNGSNASESIDIAANGGRIVFFRDVAAVTMDLDDVERIRYNALGGTDNIVIGDLSGTDATNVEINLAASGGGGDGATDTVTVNSTNAADVVAVSASGGTVFVSGLPAAVSVLGAEAANDRLVINGNSGDDVLNASALAAGLIALTINGGLGADVILGSGGNDLISGGDGNDTAFLGGGDDVFVWNPGDDNDVIEGQGGTDTLRFNASNVSESITISANGGRALLFRDVANVTMDLNDTEVIAIAALGGADTFNVGDLSGTDITSLAFDLAGTLGGAAGDAQVDTLILNGSGGANTITVSGSGTLLTITGLPATVTISTFETSGTLDRLTINGLGGDDNISAIGVTLPISSLVIDAGGGNDIVRSNGDGTYLGGIGNDMMFAGLTSSLEVMDGGDGVDTLDTTTWGGIYVINMITGVTNYSGESFLNFENLVTGAGDDTITGTSGDNIISTGAGIDTLNGGLGNDTLIGGIGADTMNGGGGNDIYEVDNLGDVVTEQAGEGFDEVRTLISNYVIPDQVERMVYTGPGGGILIGNAANNILVGGAGGDLFRLEHGGADNAIGNDGADGFFFAGAMTNADTVDGGAGADQLALQGVYAGLTFNAAGLVGVETVVLLAGNDTRFINLGGALLSYNLTTVDANVAAGQLLTFQANTLRAGENFTLNAAAETNGIILTFGGLGTETIIGGQQGDGFYFGTGRFNAGDTINGGGGSDQLGLQGNFAGANALIFGAGQLTSVEFIVMLSASDTRFGGGTAGQFFSYTLTMNDGNVAAGAQMVIQANSLRAGEVLRFNGTAETDGRFQVFGGASSDLIMGGALADDVFGGAGGDRIEGRGGADTLRGGLGADIFVYRAVGDYTAAARGQLLDFTTGDLIDLGGMDANSVLAGVQSFQLIANGAAFTAAGQLRITQNGTTALIEGDSNGDGAADFTIAVTVADGHALTRNDFLGLAPPAAEPLKLKADPGEWLGQAHFDSGPEMQFIPTSDLDL